MPKIIYFRSAIKSILRKYDFYTDFIFLTILYRTYNASEESNEDY